MDSLFEKYLDRVLKVHSESRLFRFLLELLLSLLSFAHEGTFREEEERRNRHRAPPRTLVRAGPARVLGVDSYFRNERSDFSLPPLRGLLRPYQSRFEG